MGLFDDAGVNLNNTPDDPFAFGKNYWGLLITEVREPKVSDKGKLGSFIRYQLTHNRYSRVLPFGQWMQFPTPLGVQQATGIKFDAVNNPDDIAVVNDLRDFLLALGFKLEELNSVDPQRDILNRAFCAKMKKPKRNEEGYWDLGWYMPKPYIEEADDSPGGLEIFASQNGTTNRPAANASNDIEAQIAAAMAEANAASNSDE